MQAFDLDGSAFGLLRPPGASPREGLLAFPRGVGVPGKTPKATSAPAREVGVARNTAQAHLDRLLESGVITGFGPEVDIRRVGYAVSAFVNLQISQGRGRA